MIKKINEVYELLIQNQVLYACKQILEHNKKITSLYIDKKLFRAVKHSIANFNLFYKEYEINEFTSLILISKDESVIDILEEINDLGISKKTKESIYQYLF